MKEALIIDDNEDFRAMLVDELEDWECKCTQVDRAEEALTLLKTKEFDLIFLDLRLPEPSIDGLEALQQMKTQNIDISKIITITGDPNIVLENAAIEAGVKMHLQKVGISLEKIRFAIGAVLNNKKHG